MLCDFVLGHAVRCCRCNALFEAAVPLYFLYERLPKRLCRACVHMVWFSGTILSRCSLLWCPIVCTARETVHHTS